MDNRENIPLRTFLGIPLPHPVASSIASFSRPPSPSTPANPSFPAGWRWLPEHNLHLTLKFLGPLDPAQIQELTPHLAAVRAPAPEIQLLGAGCFDRAGVLFVGVACHPHLLSLQSALESASARIGIPPELRPYHPHITVARFPRRSPVQLHREIIARLDQHLATLSPSRFTAEQFILYHSASGNYQTLRRFSLDSHPPR